MILRKFLLIAGLGLLLAGCSLRSTSPADEEEPKPKLIDQADLPYVKLKPLSDRHRLDVSVYQIKAPRIDYQVLYTAVIKGNSVQRGAGGRNIDLRGQSQLIRVGNNAVVFGSESSGKFRYDEGVENGSFEITYRDSKGKSIGRAQTDWQLQDSKTASEFTSADGKFKFKPSGKVKGLLLTMNTLGSPVPPGGAIIAGPYAVYSSDASNIPGSITLTMPTTSPAKLLQYDDSTEKWKELASSVTGANIRATVSSLSVFIAVAL